MSHTTGGARVFDAVAALLRGEAVSWDGLGISTEELIAYCAAEQLTGLVHHHVNKLPPDHWPAASRRQMSEAARAGVAVELARLRELVGALQDLHQAGVGAVVFKGTALAYSIYESPSLRPRQDTDLFIPLSQLELAINVLAERGYKKSVYCEGELLFQQVEVQKTDSLRVCHALDLHWKPSMHTTFSEVLTCEELYSGSCPAPILGPSARIAGPLHALLIACLHPAMHHFNEERLIWLYDIHLLASGASTRDLENFVALARNKRVASICANQLGRARARLGTVIDDAVIKELESAGEQEPSAVFLQAGRRWHHQLIGDLKSLNWRKRATLLREVAFPGAGYMLRSYNLPDSAWLWPLVPLLHAARGARGVFKVLSGRK